MGFCTSLDFLIGLKWPSPHNQEEEHIPTHIVGDMITGGKPARSGQVSSMRIETHEDVKVVALYGGPKGELQYVNVNRPSHVTCIVR